MKTVFDLDDEAPKPKWRWPGRPPQVYILGLGALLFGPVALFASTQMAALIIITGSLVLLCNPVSGLGLVRRMHFLIPFILFLLFGALSGLWAIEGAEVAKRFWRLMGLGAFAILIIGHARDIAAADRQFLGKAVCAGFYIFLFLFLIERFTGSVLIQTLSDRSGEVLYAILNRPSTLLLLLVWPVAGHLFSNGKALFAFAALLATFLSTFGLVGQIASVAFLLSSCVALFGALLPRFTAWLCASVIGLAFLLAPIVFNQSAAIEALGDATPVTSTSIFHRYIIWDFTAEQIAERPLAGWGLDSSRFVPDGDTPALAFVEAEGYTWIQNQYLLLRMRDSTVLPLHPHSLILQSWLELGLLGAVLVAGFIISLLFKCVSGSRSARACRFGFFVSAFVIASVSYGAWQSWWLASLAFTTCFITALPPKPKTAREWPEVERKEEETHKS